MASKNRKTVWLLGILVLLALALLLSMGNRGFLRQIRIRLEKHRLDKEISRLEQEKQHLNAEIDSLDTPEAVEKIAREQYGMAREDEVIYRVVPK